MKVALRSSAARRAPFKKSPISILMAPPSPFNTNGVVEFPAFVLARPNGTKGGITLTVRAHCIGEGQWIAAATWGSQCGQPRRKPSVLAPIEYFPRSRVSGLVLSALRRSLLAWRVNRQPPAGAAVAL